MGKLVARVQRPDQRQQHDGGVRPRGEPGRPVASEGQQEPGDHRQGDDGEQEAPRQRVDTSGELVERRQSRRPEPLPRVEQDAIGRHGQSGRRPVLRVVGEQTALLDGDDGDDASDHRNREVGQLLHDEVSPPHAHHPPERVGVENEQGHRQRRHLGLAEEGRSEGCDRGQPPAAPGSRIERSEVGQHRQQEEQAA